LKAYDLKGYSSWEHWGYGKHRGFYSCKDLRKFKESIERYSFGFESPYNGHLWVQYAQEQEDEYNNSNDDDMYSSGCNFGKNVTYVGVLRSDISRNLDLYVVKYENRFHVLMEKDYDRCVSKCWVIEQGPTEDYDDYYDNSDNTIRKLETHGYMVCGFGVDDDKPFFMLASRYGVIYVSPAELRLMVAFNAVGGLCIHNNSVYLTSAMRRVYGCKGAEFGQYSLTTGKLTLPLPRYLKDEDGWYMKNESFYTYVEASTVYELLSAGIKVNAEDGHKLTKAALAKNVIRSGR